MTINNLLIKDALMIIAVLASFGTASISSSAEPVYSGNEPLNFVTCLAPAIDNFRELSFKDPSKKISKLLKSLSEVINDHESAAAAAAESKWWPYTTEKAFEHTLGISERSRKLIELVTWDGNSQSDRNVFDSLRVCYLAFHSKLYFTKYYKGSWDDEETSRKLREYAKDDIDNILTRDAMKKLGDKGGDYDKYKALKYTGLIDRGGDKGPLDRQPKFFSKKSIDTRFKKTISGRDLARISEKIRYLKGLKESCECFQPDDDDGPADLVEEFYCKSVSDSNLDEVIADFENLQSIALSEAQSQGVDLLWGKKKPKLAEVRETELAAQIEALNSSRGTRKDSANQLKNNLVRALIQYAAFAENEKLMCAVKAMNPGKLEAQPWRI